MALSEGIILRERYKIKKKIGEGGYGCIYLADDLLKRKEWAIKEMLDTCGENINIEEKTKQFRFEAEILVTLEHPQLPKVEDYFEYEGKFYLVMEYISGNNLYEIVEKNVSYLSQEQIIDWFFQLCDILDYLHSHHSKPVVFRDLKPENIMLSQNSKIMLIDFGISKLKSDKVKTHVAAQSVTPHFAPPEQYGIEGTDPLSDIYSLGATIYYLITRTLPADSIHRLTAKTEPMPCPSLLNKEVSEGLEHIILKAMSLKKEDRFQSVKEIKEELQKIYKSDLVTRSINPNEDNVRELKKSCEQFRLMVENANDLILTLDREGVITYISKKVEKIFGLPAEMFPGKHFVNFLPPESAVKAMQYFRAPIEGDPRLQLPPLCVEAFTHDRKPINLEVTGSRIFDGDKILSRICVVKDVTSRIEEEQKLNIKLQEFQFLNRVILMASGGEFIEQKLRNIMEELRSFVSFDSVRVITMDKSGEYMQIFTAYPEISERFGETEKRPMKNTVIEKIMLNRKAIVAKIIKDEIAAGILSENTKSAVFCPIILINSFLGVLVIESEELYKYIDDYPRYIESIAQITGMIIRLHRSLEWGLLT
jgi:PAS domain S-box-containing protein